MYDDVFGYDNAHVNIYDRGCGEVCGRAYDSMLGCRTDSNALATSRQVCTPTRRAIRGTCEIIMAPGIGNDVLCLGNWSSIVDKKGVHVQETGIARWILDIGLEYSLNACNKM